MCILSYLRQFWLGVNKKKEEPQIENQKLDVQFSQMPRGLIKFWEYIYIRIAKGFCLKTFASLCCGLLEAPSIPNFKENIILYLPNPTTEVVYPTSC